mgnify:CR=1 FL=1
MVPRLQWAGRMGYQDRWEWGAEAHRNQGGGYLRVGGLMAIKLPSPEQTAGMGTNILINPWWIVMPLSVVTPEQPDLLGGQGWGGEFVAVVDVPNL